MKLHIRWMIRRDMAEVLDIEAASFRYPWDEADFIKCLRNRNCIGMVAEHDERVVGYMMYELFSERIDLLNLAVHAECRRSGVGSRMVAKLKSKLSIQRRRKIVADISEWNLDGQLFFKRLGFMCIGCVADQRAKCPGCDAYWFEYQFDEDETRQAAALFRTANAAKEVAT